MKITLTSRRMEITEPLREYVEAKVSKLSRFKDNIKEAQVILSVEKYRQMAEIYISGNGFSLSSTEETPDMYMSIDGAIEKLERQVKKFNKRRIDSKRGPQQKIQSAAEIWSEGSDADGEQKRRLVKIDAFVAKPMSVDEAIMQLDYRDQEIIMFRNARNDDINVVYLRADGNIGLIEPEF